LKLAKRHIRSLLIAGFMVAVHCAPGYGQIAGGMDETTRTDLGGKHFIVGMVFGPDGTPMKSRVRIRLWAMTAREVITDADDNGKFIFSGLPNGSYMVYFDGDADLQPISTSVVVDFARNVPPQSIAISFRLQPKRRADDPPSVVSADTAGVPKKAMEHYRKARELSASGDDLGATAELNAALKIHPGFSLALIELGIQQLKAGELISADATFAKALDLKPDSFEAMVNRGIGLFRQKNFPEAERFLRDALKIKSDSDLGHYYLGRTFLARDLLDNAEQELDTALELSGGKMVEVHRMKTQLYIQKDDFGKALAALDSYIAAVPNAPDMEKLRKTHVQLEQAKAAAKP
jgi:Flp pilus assembly protein TadD